MRTDIGISDKNRAAVAAILTNILADEYVLYTKTRNFHWNVVGPNFSELHKFFESQYEKLNEVVDEVAERIRAVGHVSPGSMAEFLKHARLKEVKGETLAASKMIRILLDNHEEIINFLREDVAACAEKYEDAGTSDFLTGLMEDHEKMAWMLRASLE